MLRCACRVFWQSGVGEVETTADSISDSISVRVGGAEHLNEVGETVEETLYYC